MRASLMLIAVNVALFIVQNLVEGFTDLFVLTPDIAQRPWILVTSMFLHGSPMHLLGNMLALFLFGLILEQNIGSRKFLYVYFAVGIIAGIVSSNFYASSLGASGAIFGVLGTLAAMKPRMMVWVYGVPMPMAVAAGFWLLLDIAGVFFPSNVANIAHIAGLLFGIAIGLYLHEPEPKLKKEKVLKDDEFNRWEDEWF